MESSMLESDWLAPRHPIQNAKFLPITALLNRSTYHKSVKGSPPPHGSGPVFYSLQSSAWKRSVQLLLVKMLSESKSRRVNSSVAVSLDPYRPASQNTWSSSGVTSSSSTKIKDEWTFKWKEINELFLEISLPLQVNIYIYDTNKMYPPFARKHVYHTKQMWRYILTSTTS